MTPLDPRALRNAFGSFMTGVTVVTAHDKTGQPLGFTANSFTSVSLDPPLVLVCLANSSQNYDALVSADGFAVNILAESQIDISNTFARPTDDRFAGLAWSKGPFGSPIIAGVSAWFDCRLHRTVDAGDHVILIGQVEAFEDSSKPGLGYSRGAYFTPSATAEALAQNSNLVVSAIIERNGEVLLVDDGNGGMALPETTVVGDGTTAALKKLIETTGMIAAPGFIYSVFEDVDRKRQHISFLCKACAGKPKNGVFVPLTVESLDDVTSPAILTMLERLSQEASIGEFGIYFGNQNSGEVRPMK